MQTLQTIRAFTLGLALTGLALLPVKPAVAAGETDILTLVPSNAEAVASINFRKISDSPEMKTVLDARPRFQKILQQIKVFSSVDLMKDLDHGIVFGHMDREKEGAAIFQGRFNQERLMELARVNEEFSETEISGTRVYQWKDGRERELKFGAFLPGGVVVVSNSTGTLEAIFEARGDAKKSLPGSDRASLLPAGYKDAGAWATVARPAKSGKASEPFDVLQVQTAEAVLSMTDNDMKLACTLHLGAGATQQDWVDFLKGVSAMGRIQKKNANVARMAERMKVQPSADGKSVSMELAIPRAEAQELLNKRLGGK